MPAPRSNPRSADEPMIDHPLSRRIAHVVDLQPDARALEFDGEWISWGRLASVARSVGSLVDRYGGGGDTQVGILLRNRPPHVAALLGVLLGGGCAGGKADPVSLSAVHIESFGRYQNLNSFVAQDPLHFLGDVAILAGHQLRPGLDDRHAADGSRFLRTWHAIPSSRLPKWFWGVPLLLRVQPSASRPSRGNIRRGPNLPSARPF